MRWFFPSYNGDFRLEADGENSKLIIEKATAREMDQLAEFCKVAIKNKWLKRGEGFNATDIVALKASVADAGKALIKCVRAPKGTLTAVKMVNGELIATDETGAETRGDALDLLVAGEAEAAVSVSRPTPCCPDCLPGAVPMASEVLQTFLSPEQHESWAKHRQMIVVGHLSGHRYLLSHRHHPRAVKDTRICADLDYDGAKRHDPGRPYVLKFFDWSVPPEEEVLAAKLILEHREPWLRNEATLFHELQNYYAEPIFKNPFGDKSDGTSDAALFEGMGAYFRAAQQMPKRGRPTALAALTAAVDGETLLQVHSCQIPEWA